MRRRGLLLTGVAVAGVAAVLAPSARVRPGVTGAAGFPDVDAGAADAQEIARFAAMGLDDGEPGADFRPEDPVTRGELARMLHRFAGAPANEVGTVALFADVDASHPLAREIAWLKGRGVVSGWIDGTFRPDAPLTRAEQADVLHTIAVLPLSAGDAAAAPIAFPDVDPAAPGAGPIGWAGALGLTPAVSGSPFEPERPVSRREIVRVLVALDDALRRAGY